MRYYLMHKDICVAEMEIDSNGDISKIKTFSQYSNHLPLGCQMNLMKFKEWWKDRAVPKTRKGANHALRELGLPSTQSMLVNNLALSLTDCYWIKPVGANLLWRQVSLFSNNFTDIFGDLTFNTNKHLNLNGKTVFRCASSQGELQKKWCIDNNGYRFLVKGNWGSSYQQSLNETFASLLHSMQGFSLYTNYGLTQVSVEGNQTGIGCYSYNFCSENVEFISAWEVLQTVKLRSNESWYLKFKNICTERFGFTEEYVNNFLGYQIMTDFIISNTDRHMNNLGVLRNPDTLEYIGFAPIFDSGNSMFFRNSVVPTGNLLNIETHSFLKSEVSMLKYVTNRNLVDLNKVPHKKQFYSCYMKDIPERHSRIPSMYNAYCQKINYLGRFQSGEDIWKF